jgi:hypothetical protein
MGGRGLILLVRHLVLKPERKTNLHLVTSSQNSRKPKYATGAQELDLQGRRCKARGLGENGNGEGSIRCNSYVSRQSCYCRDNLAGRHEGIKEVRGKVVVLGI